LLFGVLDGVLSAEESWREMGEPLALSSSW